MIQTMITARIPVPRLLQRLRSHTGDRRQLQLGVSGAHAGAYAHPESPFELRGIYVEPTERLLGLIEPPRSINWIGEIDGCRVDFAAHELAHALRRLVRGDGALLERILAPQQLIIGDNAKLLQRIARGVICRRFQRYYRTFCKGVMRDYGERDPTVAHLLAVYRKALTGIHLMRTGDIKLELLPLAQEYGFPEIGRLVSQNQQHTDAVLLREREWNRILVRLQTLLEQAFEQSDLPLDPEHPSAAEHFLIDVRRQFFDAQTIQESGPESAGEP